MSNPFGDSVKISTPGRYMLLESEAEFNVLLTAVDETFSQTVHSRSSYTGEEVLFGRRFEMMFAESDAESGPLGQSLLRQPSLESALPE